MTNHFTRVPRGKQQPLLYYLSFFQGFLRTDTVAPSYAVQSEYAPRETANRALVQTRGRYNRTTKKIQLQPENRYANISDTSITWVSDT